ncbi:MAG: HD domain-containing protein [Candidatus Diapherotrites archaeon]
MSLKELKDTLALVRALQNMKELPRQGYIAHGFKRNDVDSVASHSHSVAVTSLMLSKLLEKDYKIDTEKLLKFALLHDMGEAVLGDIGYMTKVFAKGAIEGVEDKAFRSLFKNVSFGNEFIRVQEEYVERKCIEARIVKIADKIDSIAWVTNSAVLTESARKIFVNDAETAFKTFNAWDPKLGKLFKDAAHLLFNEDINMYHAFGKEFQN